MPMSSSFITNQKKYTKEKERKIRHMNESMFRQNSDSNMRVKWTKELLEQGLIELVNQPGKDGRPDGHGRFSLRGKGEGYIGNVVNGSISHNETLGCLSAAVDSSQPTCIFKSYYSLFQEKM